MEKKNNNSRGQELQISISSTLYMHHISCKLISMLKDLVSITVVIENRLVTPAALPPCSMLRSRETSLFLDKQKGILDLSVVWFPSPPGFDQTRFLFRLQRSKLMAAGSKQNIRSSATAFSISLGFPLLTQ